MSADTDLYDPEQALALAGGRPALRDQTLIRLLELLADPAGGGLLCDVTRYGPQREACYEVAHQAVGLAQQAALPQLARLLRALTTALADADLAAAHALGQRLPAAIDAVQSVLASSDHDQPS